MYICIYHSTKLIFGLAETEHNFNRNYLIIGITLIIMILYLLYIKVIKHNDTSIQRDVYMKWCWIKNNIDHNLFLYIYLGLQLLMMLYIVITVCFIYYSISVKANEMDIRKRRNNLKLTSMKLVAYPIIDTSGWIFTLVSNVLPVDKDKFESSKIQISVSCS